MSDMKEGRWCPDECPITGLKFFMWLEHPELGYVPTYGGPFDSFTLAALDEDGYLRSERYDHDEGSWVEGGQPMTARAGLILEADLDPSDEGGEDIQPTPESERAAFHGMMRWHLIRLLQAWRYGGDLRAAGMAAFEWARTNDVGQDAFKASERAVKLAAAPVAPDAGAPTLWEAFEMGFGLRSAMMGHVLDGRDVGRLTTCEFWHPALHDMHIGTDLHVGLTVGEAIVRLKAEVRRRLERFITAPATVSADAAAPSDHLEFMPVDSMQHQKVYGTPEAIDALKKRMERDYQIASLVPGTGKFDAFDRWPWQAAQPTPTPPVAADAAAPIQYSDELTPRTAGEKAAYLEGIEEGKMRAVRDGAAAAQASQSTSTATTEKV